MSCGCGCGCDSCQACDCCQGTHAITPEMIDNRPGLPALRYRVGTHGAFLETMKARLSSQDFPALARLTTRDPSDTSIAMLDAWATVGDVLSFYTERIANEGYLRTATERRSVLELARLVGYAPRPGVASSVYLAYSLEDGHEDVPIAKGTRAQSVPGPGELPQSFETSEPLLAQSKLSAIHARMTRPQRIQDNIAITQLNIKGLGVSLRVGDQLLFGFEADKYALYQIQSVTLDASQNRVKLEVLKLDAPKNPIARLEFQPESALFAQTLIPLQARPSLQPKNATFFERNPLGLFQNQSDLVLKSLFIFHPEIRRDAYKVLEVASVTSPSELISIEVLRIKAGLFGNAAPQMPVYKQVQDGEFASNRLEVDHFQDPPELGAEDPYVQSKTILLDATYDQIKTNHRVVVVQKTKPNQHDVQVYTVQNMDTVSPRLYGLMTRVTQLELNDKWPKSPLKAKKAISDTTVYAVGEKLEIAEEIIETDVFCDASDSELELDSLYHGLESGRWIIIQGERMLEKTGVDGKSLHEEGKLIYRASGIVDAELAMIASVQHRFAKTETGQDWAGDTLHTFIKFAVPLKWRFKRDTVVIYANVVKATHGETRREVLGAGDASLAFQRFDLKQPPLTYLPVPTAAGAQSTLEIRVNEVRWDETPFLAGLEPNDRGFEIRIEDDGQTSVVFGDGLRGSRLPTGRENITALYRNGIGKPGNVAANKITLLANKPFGVRSVVNPIRVSGGADHETRDQARRNAPLAVMALDRLVGVRDYEDFARTFAGIAKASARRLIHNGRAVVHVTVAGLDDIPIDENSDLYRNLREAFGQLGDPELPVLLAVRESLSLVIKARVRVGAAYLWEFIEPKIRAAMLEHFGFEARELGQDAVASEVLSIIQDVPGVEYVDLDHFGFVSEQTLLNEKLIAEFVGTDSRVQAKLARLEPEKTSNRLQLNSAQLAFLTPAVADTLLLSEIK